jgi:6-phosphofructokinase 1
MSSATPQWRIGVFTSGGDSCGMNSAVRACTRIALRRGAQVFAIKDGFSGMHRGDLKELLWADVAGIMARGGTVIGTARCAEFRTVDGRRQAAMHLAVRGINALVCVGGDGSLTGADTLLREWPEHLAALVAAGLVSEAQRKQCAKLHLVGFTGTIDNDMFGTDATIGVWSALTRIVDAIDCLQSTAESHRRCFVVECMGRASGFLSVLAALVTGSEYAIFPEAPPGSPTVDWRDEMCDILRKCRTVSAATVVVVCEGAVDWTGKRIEAAECVRVIEERLGVETRLTVLGHVQRGGVPVPADRYIATMMGAKAIDVLMSDMTEPQCIGMAGETTVVLPLRHCVAQCVATNKALKECRFDDVRALRCGSFQECMRLWQRLKEHHLQAPPPVAAATAATAAAAAAPSPSSATPLARRGLDRRAAANGVKRVAILTCGAPAPGMSACVGALARLIITQGHEPIGIRDGFVGFARAATVRGGDGFESAAQELEWFALNEMMHLGGSTLSCNRDAAGKEVPLDSIAVAIAVLDISALVVIGGFEGYQSVDNMRRARDRFPQFQMPMFCIPATISCNVPGSDVSIGADRGLTNLVDAVDKVKQSAVGMRRMFCVEVMGRFCGYLALIGALCSGAEIALLPENSLRLAELQAVLDVTHARFDAAFDDKVNGCAVVIKNECAGGDVFTLDVLMNLFEAESKGHFDVRKSVLGHLQQGGLPTVVDRFHALRLALACSDRVAAALKADASASMQVDCAIVGIVKGEPVFTDMSRFDALVDKALRRPKEQWWLKEVVPIHETISLPNKDYVTK